MYVIFGPINEKLNEDVYSLSVLVFWSNKNKLLIKLLKPDKYGHEKK